MALWACLWGIILIAANGYGKALSLCRELSLDRRCQPVNGERKLGSIGIHCSLLNMDIK